MTSPLVWRSHLERLAQEWKAEALLFREVSSASDVAATLERAAERLLARLGEAQQGEWVDTDAAAAVLHVSAEAVRARCRRRLFAAGLARKRGGEWEVHISALAA
jgi:hypothetical protein